MLNQMESSLDISINEFDFEKLTNTSKYLYSSIKDKITNSELLKEFEKIIKEFDCKYYKIIMLDQLNRYKEEIQKMIERSDYIEVDNSSKRAIVHIKKILKIIIFEIEDVEATIQSGDMISSMDYHSISKHVEAYEDGSDKEETIESNNSSQDLVSRATSLPSNIKEKTETAARTIKSGIEKYNFSIDKSEGGKYNIFNKRNDCNVE